MSFLDPTVKDCAQLIQGGSKKWTFRSIGKVRTLPRRVRPAHGYRRTSARPTRIADRQERRAKVDAEVIRIRAENERYKQAKVAAFEAWDSKLKAAKALIEEKWTEYYSQSPILKGQPEYFDPSSGSRTCDEAVAPLVLKLRSDIDALGEEPLGGPRFSKESELWWMYQHARTALSRAFGNEAGVYEDAKREAVEDARDFPSTVRVGVAEGTVRGHRADLKVAA